jgi:hypothetical protein
MPRKCLRRTALAISNELKNHSIAVQIKASDGSFWRRKVVQL